MVTFVGPPSGATRNKPITAELEQVLDAAAQAAGIDKIVITSGGQDALGEGNRRTGSTRHDRGRAADLQCVVGGRTLTFTDQNADPIVLAFVSAAAAAGATGIGAGVGYMGNRTIHVGFGTSPSDNTRLTWGVAGSAANAPQWLRDAAGAGWASPNDFLRAIQSGVDGPGRYVVTARSGLKLRGGPGTDFASDRTLEPGTELDVIAIDADPSWVIVDLEGDGLLDGFVFAAFLAPAGAFASNEDAPEPGGDS